MALYICNKCKNQKELKKQTLVLIKKNWMVKEALCICGNYMESKTQKGIPYLIRTEPSLKK
jgi:hypothetical protein|tara:strand:- start:563 stop:745 length:183 start_codon:yes stop_codon:yes gene_type:complete